VAKSTFDGIMAALSGGAVYGIQIQVDFSFCNFVGCRAATGTGGAVSLANLIYTSKLDNCVFKDVSSEQAGGAIYISAKDKTSEVTVHGCQFQNCTADFTAGGIAVMGANYLTLSNCSFAKDTSERGAAIGTTAVATNARYLAMADTNLLGGTVLPSMAWGSQTTLRLHGTTNLTCGRGELMHHSSQDGFAMYSCQKCTSGTFNLFGGFVSGGLEPQRNCTKCPAHSSCNRTTSISLSGYALYPTSASRRIEQDFEWLSAACPNEEACPSRDIAVSHKACKEGYTNPELGCALCDDDGNGAFASQNHDPFVCVQCPEGNIGLSALYAQLIILIPAVLSLKASHNIGKYVYSSRKQDRSFAPLLKILVSFAAILPSLSGINWGWG